MTKVTKAQSYRKSGEVMGGVTHCLQNQIQLLMFDTKGFPMDSFIFSITNKYKLDEVAPLMTDPPPISSTTL